MLKKTKEIFLVINKVTTLRERMLVNKKKKRLVNHTM